MATASTNPPPTESAPGAASTPGLPAGFAEENSLLVEEPRFAIVPEWVIDADMPDAAFRLYALLLRYGNGSGHRMPARATLARRMHRSVDAVDRAMRQLVEAGLVRVEHRKAGKQYLSNRYHVRTSSPFPAPNATSTPARGSRNSAAVPDDVGRGGRILAATPGRSSTTRVAADPRPDRKTPTERQPPPPPPTTDTRAVAGATAVEVETRRLLDACGINDLTALADQCIKARTALGKPIGRWRAPCLLAAIHLAVVTRGWPAGDVVPALQAVAGDPATMSPVRLAEAGPWWDRPNTTHANPDGADDDLADLADLEARLAELDGQRLVVQRQARHELATEGLPVTRATVTRRACAILDQQTGTTGSRS